MKKIKNITIYFMSSVLLILSLFINSQAQAVTLAFSPAETFLYEEKSFNIDLLISGLEDENLAAFNLEINYDPMIFNFANYSLGVELGSMNNFDAENWSFGDDGLGTIHLAELSWLWDFSFQPDSFVLATLSFESVSGSGNLGFSNIILGNEWGDSLYADWESADINISDTAPIPEPCTFVLLGIGLTGMAFFNKKSKIIRRKRK